MGHFPCHSVVKMPDFRDFQTCSIFCISFAGEPHFELSTEFPTCFVTVADRLAMHGRVGAGKQLSL